MTALKHDFVEFIPDELADNTIYVSVKFATVAHRCCCGCGKEVVTPLSPSDWKLTFDGETISLVPSIGNWSFPCQSHYWIAHSRVRWAEQWSQEEIAAGRAKDAIEKDRYYDSVKPRPDGHLIKTTTQRVQESEESSTVILQALKKRFSGWCRISRE